MVMSNPELGVYVQSERARGVRDEDIRTTLLASGWKVEDVTEVLSGQVSPAAPSLPVVPLLQLPSATEILREAWAIYVSRMGVFVGITLLLMLLLIAFFAVFLGGIFGISLFDEFSSGVAWVVIPFIIFVVLLGLVVVQLWGRTALLFAIKDSGEAIGVAESFKRGWKKLGSYIWVSLLVGFVTLGGFALFIVPGVLFIVWFYPAIFVVIAEESRGMDALMRSRAYVRGKWLSVFWRLFVMVVLIWTTYLPPMLVGLLNIPYLAQIMQFLLSLLLGPFVATYGFVLYRNLRRMYEGTTVAAAPSPKWPFVLVGFVGGLIVPILIMSSIVLGGLGTAKEKSRDAQRISDIANIQLASELYYDLNQQYAATLEQLVDSHYLSSMLTDPTDHTPYYYVQLRGGKGYVVAASLERGDNPVLKADADKDIMEFLTDDSIGCQRETGRHCYDIVGDDFLPLSDTSLLLPVTTISSSSSASEVSARDAQRLSDILQIQLALGRYYSARLFYPSSLRALVPLYLGRLPSDPSDKENYNYEVQKNGASYVLAASLENGNDLHLVTDTDQKIDGFLTADDQGCVAEKDRHCYDVMP